MTSIRLLSAAGVSLAASLTFVACSEPTLESTPPAARQYGAAQRIGNGTARTYVQFDADGTTPVEVGVAMSESAMEGLPAPAAAARAAGAAHVNHGSQGMPGTHVMADMNMLLLEMPAGNVAPYKFVQLDWNPAGHEPAGVYDLPHFDFHFYNVSVEVRNGILPSDPQYAAKAASFPAAEFRAPFFVDPVTLTGGAAPAAALAVPQMGMHWLDVRSPELQAMAGKPEAFQPFTKTFIYGSWNGAFIFDEPMITRAYILSKRSATDPAVRDELIPVSTPARYAQAGFHPTAYRIAYDSAAKEYRIAVTRLTR